MLVRDGVGKVVVDREEGGFGRVVFGVSRDTNMSNIMP